MSKYEETLKVIAETHEYICNALPTGNAYDPEALADIGIKVSLLGDIAVSLSIIADKLSKEDTVPPAIIRNVEVEHDSK